MKAMRASGAAVAAVVAAAGAAVGQVGTGGTITDGNTSFTQPAYTGGATGSGPVGASLTVGGPGNPNHLYQAWWWYRVEGENRESAFNNATSATFSGNHARLEYSESQFRAVMQYHVTGISDGIGLLTQTMTIVNTTPNRLVITLFNYADLDMAGTSGGDSATLNNPGGGDNIVRVADSGWIAYYEGTDLWQVDQYAAVRNVLTNSSADDLNNSGLPFGPGDFTGAFQWVMALEPFSAATASATITIVPSPASLALLGLGGVAAASRRRRR